jgi:hypothetical protein
MSKRPLSGAQRQARYLAKQRARNDQIAHEVVTLRKRLARLQLERGGDSRTSAKAGRSGR